ncbi:N-acetylmuramoyl-L-alanine amidase family protein [Cohnella sp. WQ 127256]|uniref:N-acetylmuramoyl-L-alanine amidase family protein n=1 Tax=Cohnella sp. WQ 127256 TaxID=2938790 RepID=UPI0021173F9C|nr:N-acetylmuramoyl-L-alanine amidase family protein [Cohnella sp. WQ 127256]
MKKWLLLLSVVACMFSVLTCMLFLNADIASAAKTEVQTPRLVVDGHVLQPKVPPVIIKSTTMIPVRIAAENLGYKVDYNNKQKQVTVSKGTKQLVMTLDKSTAYLDKEPLQMVLPPMEKSSTTLVPLRFLSDAFGVQVVWDNKSKSAFLFSNSDTDSKPTEPSKPPTGGDDIGIVDGTDNTDGGGTGSVPPTDNTEVPLPPVNPVVTGNLYEVNYSMDTVVIRYEGTIAPKVFKLNSPNRIVVDFPNTQYRSNFFPAIDFTSVNEGKLLVSENAALTSIRYSMFGEALNKAPRFVLDLNQPWDYEVVDDATVGELRILLKQPLPDKSLFTVVLDAGHGGSDPGAVSITKKAEKVFNLSVILKVRDLLAGDERLKLVLTREDDSFPTLADRYKLANAIQADLFVSVHANSYNPDTNGTETYYSRDDSKAFADLMHSVFAPSTGLKDNGVRKKSLAVTRETVMPAILLEAGYLSSKIDEPQLWTEDFQNRVAQAIATGIKLQLKLY